MDAIILAAGLGRRMAPLTATVPKPLLPVGTHSLLEHQLYKLARSGFTKIIINVSYLYEIIEKNIGSGEKYGVEIHYSEEPGGPYGTAAGIRHALAKIETDLVLVMNGDIFTDIDPAALSLPDNSRAHLIMVRNPAHNPDGDFTLENGRLRLPTTGDRTLTFAGIGVYARTLFTEPQLATAGLGAMLRRMITMGLPVTGEQRDGLWIDVGTVERLELARRHATPAGTE